MVDTEETTASDNTITDDSNTVSADANICQNCGWREDPAEKNYRKCPNCGAEFIGKYVERVFADISDS